VTENLTPVVLELGGQNPALIDETVSVKIESRPHMGAKQRR
jgi:acyl-CoA reductase-like NAD-dependent aldehyde dehydrogenase